MVTRSWTFGVQCRRLLWALKQLRCARNFLLARNPCPAVWATCEDPRAACKCRWPCADGVDVFRAQQGQNLTRCPPVPRDRFFGWTKANEISNGRWVMFGWAVGLLTEFATGVDFPHQFALMSTYLGIMDLE